jgi:hypothetical protein
MSLGITRPRCGRNVSIASNRIDRFSCRSPSGNQDGVAGVARREWRLGNLQFESAASEPFGVLVWTFLDMGEDVDGAEVEEDEAQEYSSRTFWSAAICSVAVSAPLFPARSMVPVIHLCAVLTHSRLEISPSSGWRAMFSRTTDFADSWICRWGQYLAWAQHPVLWGFLLVVA